MDDLQRGSILVVEETRLDTGIQAFLLGAREREALIITRRSIDQLDSYLDLSRFEHYRLGLASNDPSFLSPHDLPRLSKLITDFVQEDRPGIVLLEGIEYLSIQQNYRVKFPLDVVHMRT